jgi:multiple inositol-polyphosphate phosphatase/2,3-bisphosphoglycerate 3-phosphatase
MARRLLLLFLSALTAAAQAPLVAGGHADADGDLLGEWSAPERVIERQVLREHMSTKTLYPAPAEAQTLQDDAAARMGLPQCSPVQLNFVVRHGTRFPTHKDITRMRRTHAKLRDLLAGSGSSPGEDIPPQLEWLQTWESPYPMEDEGTLARAGVEELMGIGERLRSRFFPSEAAPGFSEDAFTLEHTWKLRTRQSAEAFAYGFFGGVQPVHLQSAPMGSDHVLRFYDNCPAFERGVDKNKSATIEHAQYRSSAQMRSSLARFRRVLSVDESAVDQADLEAAYAACAFDVAVWGEENHWCALFDDETLLSMDYFHDLKHFYKKGHGNAVAFEIAAPLLQDVVTSMKRRAVGASAVRGHFRFAHAETILPLASLLNLSFFDRHASERDGHFLADTPLHVALTRNFNGAALAPFAANIGFVLYECRGPEGDDAESQFKVRTLLNERDIHFRECGGDGKACTLEQIETIFRRWLLEYDFHLECAV